MTHTEQRLQEREIELTSNQIMGLVYEYGDLDTDLAIIVKRVDHRGTSQGSYFGRTDSNGDLIVLIIRNHIAKTIMYRRSSQTNTPAQLRVNQIIDISH